MLDQAEAWCSARLRALLGEPSTDGLSLTALRPFVSAWFAERAPGIAAEDDWLAIEVSHQLGDDTDPFPIEPPPGLDENAEWFSIGLLRVLNVPAGENHNQVTVGLDLWWPAMPTLQALLSHPQWDTGNLLGFDCLGNAGPGSEQLMAAPVVTAIFEAFGNTPPSAAQLVSGADDDRRLL